MTPKISLVTVVAVALVAVPAAMGQSQAPDVIERAAAAQQLSTPIVSPDAVDRMKALQFSTQAKPIHSPDAFERAAAATADYGNRIVFDDRFNEPTNVPVASSPTSGRDFEWPQIGLGFGLGIVLALGLVLAMRHTRFRLLELFIILLVVL